MYRDVVFCFFLRGHVWLLLNVGMYILFCHEFFVEVESARHLEDKHPAVVLSFSGFIEGYKGALGVQC